MEINETPSLLRVFGNSSSGKFLYILGSRGMNFEILYDCNRIDWDSLEILEVHKSPWYERVDGHSGGAVNGSIGGFSIGRFTDVNHLVEARNDRGKLLAVDVLETCFEISGSSSSIQDPVPLMSNKPIDNFFAKDRLATVENRTVVVENELAINVLVTNGISAVVPKSLQSDVVLLDPVIGMTTSLPCDFNALQSLFGGHFINNHGSFNISINYYQSW